MPARKLAPRISLSRNREITITVIGRKSGRSISIPVWFALDGDSIYLLPSRGSGAPAGCIKITAVTFGR